MITCHIPHTQSWVLAGTFSEEHSCTAWQESWSTVPWELGDSWEPPLQNISSEEQCCILGGELTCTAALEQCGKTGFLFLLEQESIAEWEHQYRLQKEQWYIVEMTQVGKSVLEQIYTAVLEQIGILFLEQWQEQ